MIFTSNNQLIKKIPILIIIGIFSVVAILMSSKGGPDVPIPIPLDKNKQEIVDLKKKLKTQEKTLKAQKRKFERQIKIEKRKTEQVKLKNKSGKLASAIPFVGAAIALLEGADTYDHYNEWKKINPNKTLSTYIDEQMNMLKSENYIKWEFENPNGDIYSYSKDVIDDSINTLKGLDPTYLPGFIYSLIPEFIKNFFQTDQT